jgi:hypothetical protein
VVEVNAPTYRDFLARKQARVFERGHRVDIADVHPSLRDWQARIVAWAVAVGCARGGRHRP